ncbi:hypothetical protein M441DRAFT_83185 [Trichoderma asperellum CBS 433.97]|uniref:Protein kinase domain-containing protein n=1 Tax=Trichoderma asperellum (strain ATCC 204424 / CBS 433.97 / NBRC 101777) TaxID=1042311 RepID=A0A2T3YXI7_TRIA4|nr:hypothetical protein M441DRAFT_83185 [Trichoderma asperellum CBS 433.97]PTB37278.1 hypothetical protein M441DRAFT_83185 [Trichoderma asperellum CBS 433.97]
MSAFGPSEEFDPAKTKPRGSIPKDDFPPRPEIIPIESQNLHGPGILTVAIYEGLDLTVPSEYEEAFKHEQDPLTAPTTATQARGSLLSMPDHQNLPHAVLEFDSSQIHVKARSGTLKNPVWEKERGRSYNYAKFDVFRPGELTIRLYAKHQHSRERSQDIFLGTAKLYPCFEHESSSQTRWLQINNGTGRLHIKVEYAKNKTLHIRTSIDHEFYKRDYVDYGFRVGILSSNCCYECISIPKSANFSHSDVIQALLSPVNNNPFIAPLKFAAQTPTKLCFFWASMSGGYLFYYLQMAQRFRIDRARLYTAEILVALEWLHDVDPSYYHFEPRNFLLDSMGHVVLHDPRLIYLGIEGTEIESDITVDYLAPELLTSKGSTSTITTASKWWTLGVFLYEMLTGLPPFYNEDMQERCRNILSEPLEVSKLLPASAQDLLAKLLIRNPGERLGANGASEIKEHPFFDELDWNKVARREYEPAFKPPELTAYFEHRKHQPLAELVHLFDGFENRKPDKPTTVPAAIEPHQPAIVPVAIESHRITAQSTSVGVEKKEDWELVWNIQDQAFHFFNCSTKDKKPITNLKQKYTPPTKQHSQSISITHQDGKASIHESSDANVHDFPNETQRQGALDAVLKNKYLHLVPVLLKEYTTDVNFDLSFTSQTPLEYVTELGDVPIVELFLATGADANTSTKSSYTLGGRPLLSAVQQGNHELVKILVQKTDRIPCTRALGHAITKRDISIINILLANGVKCDFKDSDRPLDPKCRDHGGYRELFTFNMTYGDKSEPAEYTPPLIRAIVLGDEDLVRLLLAHGADVNIGFHDLNSSMLPSNWPININCGRPIQLAMELEHYNMVQLLLDKGADINLAQPILQHHDCKMIPRMVYHQIISRLRSMTLSATIAN